MAQKRKRKNNGESSKNKPKLYTIKMPVYTTSMMDDVEGLFGKTTYEELISFLKGRLSSFVSPISTDNRNKTKKTVISKINSTEVSIGDVPALLLQINAFNTNLYDGYFEGNEKINFTRDNKIGSDSNYVLFYPRIVGLSAGKYTRYFLMLVYEDPTKDSGEVSRIAKIVANKILNIPIQNIKMSMILDELKAINTIPELSVRYYSLTESDNNVDVKYASYLNSMKLKKEETRNFKNMPIDTMTDLISDSTEDGNYQKKETWIRWGRREYKITKQLIAEAGEELKETAEKIFNATSAITQKELEEKIHDKQFMIEKMSDVITNYISSYDE
jgi:hypothetical protein